MPRLVDRAARRREGGHVRSRATRVGHVGVGPVVLSTAPRSAIRRVTLRPRRAGGAVRGIEACPMLRGGGSHDIRRLECREFRRGAGGRTTSRRVRASSRATNHIRRGRAMCEGRVKVRCDLSEYAARSPGVSASIRERLRPSWAPARAMMHDRRSGTILIVEIVARIVVGFELGWCGHERRGGGARGRSVRRGAARVDPRGGAPVAEEAHQPGAHGVL